MGQPCGGPPEALACYEMLSDDEIRNATHAQGLRIKRNNLIAASLSGFILLLISIRGVPHSPISTRGFFLGMVAGFLYANGFEYCLHRFLLHSVHGLFSQQHMVHHSTLHSPDAARYVNFSSNPWGVVALFFANAVPVLLLQWFFHAGWVAGVFPSFAFYYMAFEEIHWRTHIGGWLPRWLRPAAKHHLLHHTRDTERFNVFLPLFDWVIDPILSARTRGANKRRA
jgi:Fatty acid hydroxylase